MAKKVMNDNFMRQKLGNPTEELLTEVTVAVLCGFLMLPQRRFQTKCMITSGTEEVVQIISVLSTSRDCSKSLVTVVTVTVLSITLVLLN